MNSSTIVGYQFRADVYHPACMVMVFLGTAAARDEDAERVLSFHAATMGIDRDDEHMFDSDIFPKVVFLDMADEDSSICGKCLTTLIDHEVPRNRDRMDGWEWEGPDASVGIFGSAWLHVLCPEGDDADSEVDVMEADLGTVLTDRRNGTLTTYVMLTCLDCGQQRLVTSTDYDPEAAQLYAAEEFGKQHGDEAASWVFNGNTPVEEYRRVLLGLEVGDPAVMEMCPSPLSGEFADGLKPNDVFNAVGMNASDISSEWGAKLLDVFDEAFTTAWWNNVEATCRYHTSEEPGVLASYRLERDGEGHITRRVPADR